MTCEADWWVPSSKYGLPLTPSGDSCRTSRHALTQIAQVKPQTFITSVAKEIARYNNLATNAQALQINLQQHVLTKCKAELLHLVELLISHSQQVKLLVTIINKRCFNPKNLTKITAIVGSYCGCCGHRFALH